MEVTVLIGSLIVSMVMKPATSALKRGRRAGWTS